MFQSLHNLCVLFSSALADIKIAEVDVKGLFVKLTNSSPDKEVEIGNCSLQQNVKGQALSLYRFPPNVVMQADSTVTVSVRCKYCELKPQWTDSTTLSPVGLAPGVSLTCSANNVISLMAGVVVNGAT